MAILRILVVAVLLVLPSVSLASSVLRSGDTVSVAINQAVEGDFYGAGNTVVVSGEVVEDVLAAAATLKINGQVGKDVLVAAGKVDVDGVVGEDLRVAAGEVVVAGEVKGDLVVVAGKLTVLSTASIAGDILFFGTEAEIAGKVGKSIYGTNEFLRVDGAVGGDVDVTTSLLTLGDQADVTGVVKYASARELVRAQNARVSGKIIQNDPVSIDELTARDVLIPLLMMLFAALVWYLLFPNLLARVVTQSTQHPTRSILIGFGLVFLTPIAVMILMVSTLGLLLGAALFFLYAGVLLMAMSVSAAVGGVYIFSLFKKGVTVTLPRILIGGLVVYVAMYVPVIGPVLCLTLFLLTVGSLATHLFRIVRVS